ncbi:hypothetical protein GCM10028895_49490 [Pontibacter rugosus]
MKHDHDHEHEHGHHHYSAKKQAEKALSQTEEQLEEKTLHAHRKAMPHGEGTPPLTGSMWGTVGMITTA